jgi:hypothetical protein
MLNMRGCTQAGITDAAFASLRGIHTLQMVDCTQAGITDAAFAHLSTRHPHAEHEQLLPEHYH